MLNRVFALLACLLLFGGWTHGRPNQTYYVSNSGNDSNNGLTPTTAWATPGKVNGFTFNSGDTIAFDGGSTFTAGLNLTQANASSFLTLTSFNAGQPTFNTGNSNGCVLATYVQWYTINNLKCVGGGVATNSTIGIRVINAGPGNITLGGPTITNNTVSQYGLSCIEVDGNNGSSGFIFTLINANTVHDCTGNQIQANTFGESCINLQGISQPFNGAVSYTVFIQNKITNNVVFNCPGTAGLTRPGDLTGLSGFGITDWNSTNTVITGNLVHDGGGTSNDCGGPVGIMETGATGALVSFNEIYNWQTGAGGCDGELLDFDGNVQNSIAEYNYLHGTATQAYILTGAFTAVTNDSNTFRFNVVEATNASTPAMQLFINAGTAGLTNLSIYNNTFYNNGITGSAAGTSNNFTVNISNNIFYLPAGGTFINSGIGATSGNTITITGNDLYPGSGSFGVTIDGTAYTSLASFQAACSSPHKIFEKTSACASAVGTTSNPNLTGTVGSGGNCNDVFTTPCPNAYTLSSATPAGKGNGLNLNSLYGLNVGTQDIYGNAVTNTTLPIGAAANK